MRRLFEPVRDSQAAPRYLFLILTVVLWLVRCAERSITDFSWTGEFGRRCAVNLEFGSVAGFIANLSGSFTLSFDSLDYVVRYFVVRG